MRAKVNTYATSGEGGEVRLEDGGRELTYAEDGWRYKDRYLGFDPFIGQEIVWKDDKIIWGMNYYGRILKEGTSTKLLYGFLKEALRRVEKDIPFRGPKEFQTGGFQYHNVVSGDVVDFHGVEVIIYQGTRVYELEYHGGVQKP